MKRVRLLSTQANRTHPIGMLLALSLTAAATAGIEFFLSDYSVDQILRFDGKTGELIDVFTNHPALDRAVNVEFGPDRNLYVANFGPGNILRFDGRTGAFMGEFARYDWLEEPVELLFRGPYLYVLGNDHHNCVLFDAHTGAFVHEFGDPVMTWPHDMVFGPDGYLYVCTENRSQGPVQIWDVSNYTLVGYFGSGSEIRLATGLAIGPDGNIYVSDWYDHEVLRYDGKTHALIDVFIPSRSGGMAGPLGMTFRPDGRVYLSNSNGVHRYDSQTGAFVDVFIPKGLGGLTSPRGFRFRSPVGDVNCDGDVNFGDINPFVLALSDPQAYEAVYPDCPLVNRDINGDGVVDFGDINPFVGLLSRE